MVRTDASILECKVVCGSLGLPTATVKLVDVDGVEYVACCVGTGPVDAALKAVDSVVKVVTFYLIAPLKYIQVILLSTLDLQCLC